jgi:hypothetical protein
MSTDSEREALANWKSTLPALQHTGQMTLIDAFETRFNMGIGCWLWLGSYTITGYGRLGRKELGRKETLAHRLSYEMHIGPIPEGLVIDHLCRNRGCVNPDHLEAVTNEENIRRGEWIPAKATSPTHCLHGHEYTPETLSISNRGERRCKECGRISARKSYAEKRAIRTAFPAPTEGPKP